MHLSIESNIGTTIDLIQRWNVKIEWNIHGIILLKISQYYANVEVMVNVYDICSSDGDEIKKRYIELPDYEYDQHEDKQYGKMGEFSITSSNYYNQLNFKP